MSALLVWQEDWREFALGDNAVYPLPHTSSTNFTPIKEPLWPLCKVHNKHNRGCAGTEAEQQGADVNNLPPFSTKSSQFPASPLAVPALLASDAICLLLLLPLQLPLFLLPPLVLSLGSVEVHLFPSLLRCSTKDWFLREKTKLTLSPISIFFQCKLWTHKTRTAQFQCHSWGLEATKAHKYCRVDSHPWKCWGWC